MSALSNTERDEHLRQFGDRVRQLREAAGLTQEALAELAGLHRAAIGHIEYARREVGVSKVWQLATALGVPPATLFEQ